jgi:hypothetical protein
MSHAAVVAVTTMISATTVTKMRMVNVSIPEVSEEVRAWMWY